MALMAALFAVTLNFLQPLAHAASMRDGNPSTLWSMFCNSAVADPAAETGNKTDATPFLSGMSDNANNQWVAVLRDFFTGFEAGYYGGKGNASSINDGASAVLLGAEGAVPRLGPTSRP